MSDLSSFSSQWDEFGKQLRNISIQIPKCPDISKITPNIQKVEIDKESTFAYQIIENDNEQIKLQNEQNEQFESNYKKLEELYNLKERELQEAKREEKKSKKYNTVMMTITIVSTLIAVAAWLLPNLLGGAA